MTFELQLLALSIVLGFVQLALSQRFKNRQYGYAWNAGPRVGEMPALNPVAGRFARATANFLETFPFFSAAVLIAHVANRHSWLTFWGVQFFFWCCVVFV